MFLYGIPIDKKSIFYTQNLRYSFMRNLKTMRYSGYSRIAVWKLCKLLPQHQWLLRWFAPPIGVGGIKDLVRSWNHFSCARATAAVAKKTKTTLIYNKKKILVNKKRIWDAYKFITKSFFASSIHLSVTGGW